MLVQWLKWPRIVYQKYEYRARGGVAETEKLLGKMPSRATLSEIASLPGWSSCAIDWTLADNHVCIGTRRVNCWAQRQCRKSSHLQFHLSFNCENDPSTNPSSQHLQLFRLLVRCFDTDSIMQWRLMCDRKSRQGNTNDMISQLLQDMARDDMCLTLGPTLGGKSASLLEVIESKQVWLTAWFKAVVLKTC